MLQRMRSDGLVRLARNEGREFIWLNANSPRGRSLSQALLNARECHLHDAVNSPEETIRLYSNNNAKFYLRNIVTSKSKSCLMGVMGDSYKSFK